MKLCPQCTNGYADHVESCPIHGGMLSEIRDLRTGMIVRNAYRIVRKLGQGGMGAVYLAEQVFMEEPRALKFLSGELSQDADFTARFRREVRTLRQVRHKNVVDSGDLEPAEDGTLFFPMEFVDGPDLRSFINSTPKPFDVPLALAITRGIAEGLGAAHAKGMVHRDIKPENILMANDGQQWIPKIADFGIVATRELSQHTQTGSLLLTPFYAAPEQWLGTRAADLDGRTDLYALGGVLFEMLTGRKVFDAENYHGWAQQHLTAVPQTPSALRPDLAKWRGLDALILRLLAKQREQRPANVAECLALIDAIVFAPAAPIPVPASAPEPLQIREPEAVREPIPVSNHHHRISHPESEPAVAKSTPDSNESFRRKLLLILLLAGIVMLGLWWLTQRETPHESTNETSAPTPTTLQDSIQTAQPAIPTPSPEQAQKADNLEKKADALFHKQLYKQAAPLFAQACDSANLTACVRLGIMYRDRDGVAEDFARAAQLFAMACNAGSADGCGYLAVGYLYGDGVPLDYQRAIDLYSRACNGGDLISCAEIAGDLENGIGKDKNFPVNLSRAAEFYGKACNLDNKKERGCVELGRLYEYGRGVEKDTNRAIEFFNKGAAAGNSSGPYALAEMYKKGIGVEKDAEKAADFLKQSCSMGSAQACYEIQNPQLFP